MGMHSRRYVGRKGRKEERSNPKEIIVVVLAD